MAQSDSETALQANQLWVPALGLALAASIIGGLVGLALIHTTSPIYEFEARGELPLDPTPEQVATYRKAHTDYYSYNYAYQLGMVGLCIGLAVGAIAARHNRVLSGLAGAVAGGLAGAVAGYLTGNQTGLAIAASSDPDLVMSALYGVGIWGSIGALIAAVVGTIESGAEHGLKSLVVGLIGGALGAVAYVVLFSVIFPNYDLMFFVPNMPTASVANSSYATEVIAQRVVWVVACTGVFGLLLGVGLKPAPDKQEMLEATE